MIQIIKNRNISKRFFNQKISLYLFILLFGILLLNCKEEENQLNSIPNAAFSVDKNVIKVDETVQFTDKSTDNPTSWDWNFGDDSTSKEQNPSHEYAHLGLYSVSLTVSNEIGIDSIIKSDYITVIPSNTDNKTSTITDVEGNIYITVTIGNQEWMAENLRVTKYADGSAIPLITDDNEWSNLGSNNTDKAYCWFDDKTSFKNNYGAYYTWAAAMNTNNSSNSDSSGIQGVCPDGWHLPSKAEWTTLVEYLTSNNYDYNGSALDYSVGKSLAATSGWNSTSLTRAVGNNQQINNSSGFTALPGGYREYNGSFYNAERYSYWWSSTQYGVSSPYFYYLSSERTVLSSGTTPFKSAGINVRCIKN